MVLDVSHTPVIPTGHCQHMERLLGAALILFAVQLGALHAEPQPPIDRPPGLEPVPEPPEIPPRVQSGETLEPDVTIIRGTKETITEYRLNGRLYAIRVEPGAGPGYWLVDADGDGLLETRRSGLDPNFLIPALVIFSW